VHADDPLLKAMIAAAIVRLGDKDDTYWDFLVKLAAPALESDAPEFMSYDSQGKAVSAPWAWLQISVGAEIQERSRCFDKHSCLVIT
jgi:hypothetical protein